MGYSWLKTFDFGFGEAFPYLKILLEIGNPWEIEVPFYTFTVVPSLQSSNFGTYLYTGKYVNTIIKPGEILSIKTNLRIIDVHADEIKRRILGLANKEQTVELTLHASIDLLNYGNPIGPYVKRLPITEAVEWVKRSGEVESEFIPAPTHNALISMLLCNISKLQNQLTKTIENKLKGIESDFKPIMDLFRKGLQEFYKDVEKKVQNQYREVIQLRELIRTVTGVSENLNQNWAVSALALSLLENLINLKLVELGEKPEGEFGKRVERLKETLIRKEGWNRVDASELARRIREKYIGRAIVLHSGYCNPISEDFAKEDLEFVKKVVKEFFKRNVCMEE